ncbi:MAG: Stp1/IreP family PP2C-type Ser/Thr phosphatase [Lachnospiraceae bacterium]|nr:Stp1/IreP family PP2C-type Ser/Thr phosphatase [Lachnospiraceae bacterium]
MRSYGMTDVGCVRTENQDNYYCNDSSLGMFENLYIVVDGMGGHNAGGYASNFVKDKLVEKAQQSTGWDVIVFIKDVLRRLNSDLLQKGRMDEDYAGMGTTAVVATSKDDKLYVTNVGDSRLYLLHEGALTQVTTDHSYVQELYQAGIIKKEEMANHPKRNMITRAVGAPQILAVDHFILPLYDGDLVLLCSDGLHGMLSDAEIEEILKEDLTLEEKTKKLIAQAKEQGGRDNIAVVLAQHESRGDQA